MNEEEVPTVVSEDYVEFLGHKLKVVVLSDGRRVFEMNDDLRAAMTLLGFDVVEEP